MSGTNEIGARDSGGESGGQGGGGREGQDSEGRRKIWWSGEDGTESGRVRAWHVV